MFQTILPIIQSQLDIIDSSTQIITEAHQRYQPRINVIMFSGGDDSLATYVLAKQLGIKIDYVMHGHTGTGIEETFTFVKETVARFGDRLLIADAENAYEEYVLRKGFFGKGIEAHRFSYHILKWTHFRRVLSTSIRLRRHNFPIFLINGARRLESENRAKTMINPIKIDPDCKSNIWVNLINEWSNHQVIDFLESNGIKRNPVSIAICRSGECMCGTMQSMGDRNEASYFFPKWGKWLTDLESRIPKQFPSRWGESTSSAGLITPSNQLSLLDDNQLLCGGCKINASIEIKIR